MREIEFRGKSVISNKWVYGWLNATEESLKNNYYWIDVNEDSYQVDPETIGQYTGLKDKNGKKIFEGDILRLCKSTKPFIIYWTGISWGAKDIYGKKKEYAFGSDLIWECEKCEVIGNIFDNGELLNEH